MRFKRKKDFLVEDSFKHIVKETHLLDLLEVSLKTETWICALKAKINTFLPQLPWRQGASCGFPVCVCNVPHLCQMSRHEHWTGDNSMPMEIFRQKLHILLLNWKVIYILLLNCSTGKLHILFSVLHVCSVQTAVCSVARVFSDRGWPGLSFVS